MFGRPVPTERDKIPSTTDGRCPSAALTLILLTWRIWWSNNARKWLMGFNLVFKGLTLILLTWRIWRFPNNARKWLMGFNLVFRGLTLILLTWGIWWSNNARKWLMGFNLVFKGLITRHVLVMGSDPTALRVKIKWISAQLHLVSNAILNAWAFQSQTCAQKASTKSDKMNCRGQTEPKLPTDAGFV